MFAPEDMTLLMRKAVYSYDYTNSWSKLDEMSLPTKEHFYGTLEEMDITDEDYKNASKVWIVLDV